MEKRLKWFQIEITLKGGVPFLADRIVNLLSGGPLVTQRIVTWAVTVSLGSLAMNMMQAMLPESWGS